MHKNDKEKIKKTLSKYLKKEVFSGCALGVSFFENDTIERDQFFVGKNDVKGGSAIVSEKTFFDVASLTKPMVTLLAILALINDGKVQFGDKLGTLLSYDVPNDKKNITLLQLISHFSGLPAHRPYYHKLRECRENERKKEIINLILHEKLERIPGTYYLYSDLDYMLLGCIVEEKSGERLDRYWAKKITDPLYISECFKTAGGCEITDGGKFASTGMCSWSARPLTGVVNDDNCRSFGSLMGHTGLFSTLFGIQYLAELFLLLHQKKKKHPSFSTREFLALLKKREQHHWACGFDVPSPENSTSGHYFSQNTIGHLGFTGTSFWVDLHQKIVIVLLTNRIIFGSDPAKIKEMRPSIHNTVMEIIKLKNQITP